MFPASLGEKQKKSENLEQFAVIIFAYQLFSSPVFLQTLTMVLNCKVN